MNRSMCRGFASSMTSCGRKSELDRLQTTFEIGRTPDGNALNRAHRREYVLSGLLTCGCCGGGYTIIGKDRYGCAARRAKGTCANGRTVVRQRIEARVLAGMKDHLLAPDMVAEAVRIYTEELAQSQREVAQRRANLERGLAETNRALVGSSVPSKAVRGAIRCVTAWPNWRDKSKRWKRTWASPTSPRGWSCRSGRRRGLPQRGSQPGSSPE